MNKEKLKKIFLNNASPTDFFDFLIKEYDSRFKNSFGAEKIVEGINSLESTPEKQIDFTHIKNFPWHEVERASSNNLISWGSHLLTVSEVDGSPSVTNIDGIIFPNGSVTDNGDGTVSIAFTAGTIDGSGTSNEITYWVDSDTVGSLTTATYPSLTELSYVKGVTSAIQTQLNGKQASGTYVTSISIASSNGFAGSSSGGATPALTLSTSITGVLKGNGTAISAATAGTDYAVGSTGLSGGQTIAGSTLTTENLTLRANAADLTTGQINVTSSKDATNTTTASVALAGGLAVAKRVYALDMTVTNTITGSVSGNAGTATVLATARTIGGVSFDGSAAITVATATGGFTVSGGNLALGANTLTLTGSIAATGARVTKGWFTDVESTNMPTVGGTAILTSLTAPSFTTVELGAGGATDTTLSRVSAGVAAIEGVNILTTATGLPLAGGTMTGSITLGENTSLALDPAGSVDGKYTGITVTGTGGATIAFGDLVQLSPADSRWELVDISVGAGSVGDARGMIGIAVTSSTDGGALTILLHGIIRADANFPTFTVGAPIYATTGGDVTVTQPTTTDHIIRVVGFAMTTDEMYFNPSADYITHV